MKKYYFEDRYKDGIFRVDIGFANVVNSFKMHSHNLCEIVYITNGNGIHQVNESEFPVSTGNIFVISDDIIHGFKECNNLNMYNIAFSTSCLNDFMIDIKELSGYHSLFVLDVNDIKKGSFKQYLKLNITQQNEITSHISNMIKIYETKVSGYKTLVYAMFLELVVKLSNYYSDNFSSTTLDNSLLADILSFIEKNYSTKLTCTDIAGYCGVSTRHINRLFKTMLNTTPVAYITSLRLDKAFNLIVHTTLTMTQIAFECGFSDSNYFIKCFKNKFNTTPRLLRTNYN